MKERRSVHRVKRVPPSFQIAYPITNRYKKNEDKMTESHHIERDYREACPHFIASFDALATYINDWAERKGWNQDDPARHDEINIRSDGKALSYLVAHDISKLGLMITELCEAIEGRRHGDPSSDKIRAFTSQEEELADCIVRIMHYAKQRNLRVAEALVEKMRYNESRPFKHGKQA